MIKSLKFKNVKIKNNIFLAPMAGYTDVAFRAMCKGYGAGLCFTEMVSAKAICMKNKKTLELLNKTKKEKPCAVQLFGSDPKAFEEAVKSGVLDDFDIIDINMGCPAPKIYGNGDGSKLMANLPLAEEIIRAVVRSTNKPVSVKFRSGINETSINVKEFAIMCEKAGATFITVHPRTREQGYSGSANWDIIKEVVKSVKIPVIASGDVKTLEDVKFLTEVCGAAGVMIGRASLGKPEIFKEIITGKKLNLSLKDKYKQIVRHIEILKEYYSENFINMTMKKHILNYVKEFKNASSLKIKVGLSRTTEEMLDAVLNMAKEAEE